MRITRRTTTSRNAPQPQRMRGVDTAMLNGRFSFIYQESFQKEVLVKHCFPMTGIRNTSHSAISALMRDFTVDEQGVVGYSAAGGLKVVVKVPEEELGLVRDYFLSRGESNKEATAKAFSQGIEWYGVVDGGHVHTALLNLQDVRPDPFLDFRWIVTVINWHPLNILQAFARERNSLQTNRVVEMTVFDTIDALHGIARKKARLSGDTFEEVVTTRGIVKKVVDEFSGGSQYSKGTIRTLAGAALRMKPEAVHTLGKIMNESDPDLCRKIMEKSTGQSTEDYITDDRAYRHLVSTSTIRGAAAFLEADGVDQSNALERLKNAFVENGLKCFQAARLTQETHRCVKARHQISLMSELMGRDSWPEEMMDIKKKLLLTSAFDAELDESDAAGNEILKSLISMYKMKMPLEAGIRLALYCRGRNTNSAAAGTTQSSRRSAESVSEGDAGIACDTLVREGETQAQNQQAQNQDNVPERCPLEELGITCHQMTLEDFSVFRNGDEDKFHLVMGDPSELHLSGTCNKRIDEHEADRVIAILKSLVQPHGWVFFYTRPVDYHLWDKAFKANDFDPLQYAWPMVRNCDTVQANTSAIPQNVTELMIGARRRGAGTPRFQPNITTVYERNVCSRKRKFAVLDSCPEPTIKLKKNNSREPVRKNERSPEPIAEFVKTFCPEQGNVLDAFAGTMETAKACFLISRRCTALEADRNCFDLALPRLKEAASSYLTTSVAHKNIGRNEVQGTETSDDDFDSVQSTDGEDLYSYSESNTMGEELQYSLDTGNPEGMSGDMMNVEMTGGELGRNK